MKKEKPCGEQGWCVYVLVAKEKVIGVLSKLDAEWPDEDYSLLKIFPVRNSCPPACLGLKGVAIDFGHFCGTDLTISQNGGDAFLSGLCLCRGHG
jgi:hypothetical protein